MLTLLLGFVSLVGAASFLNANWETGRSDLEVGNRPRQS